jgi:hypothetical protein
MDLIGDYYGNKTLDTYANPYPSYDKGIISLLPRISTIQAQDLNLQDDLRKYLTQIKADPTIQPDLLIRLSESRVLNLIFTGYCQPIFTDLDLELYNVNYLLGQQRTLELSAKNNVALRFAQHMASSREAFLSFILNFDEYVKLFNEYNQT